MIGVGGPPSPFGLRRDSLHGLPSRSSRPSVGQASEGWCGRGDSNPYALAGASPSSVSGLKPGEPWRDSPGFLVHRGNKGPLKNLPGAGILAQETAHGGASLVELVPALPFVRISFGETIALRRTRRGGLVRGSADVGNPRSDSKPRATIVQGITFSFAFTSN